jgi:hypothetical protein
MHGIATCSFICHLTAVSESVHGLHIDEIIKRFKLPEKKFRYNTFSSLSLAYTEKKRREHYQWLMIYMSQVDFPEHYPMEAPQVRFSEHLQLITSTLFICNVVERSNAWHG